MSQVARVGRRRYLRRSRFERFRLLQGDVPRSEALYDFWAREGTRLASSATGKTFTADNTTEILTSTAHGFTDGEGPYVVSNSGGALPAGLSATTLYWVSVIDADTYTLNTGRSDARVPVTFTDNGTGTQTITRAATTAAMFHVNRANHPAVIAAASDIDALA